MLIYIFLVYCHAIDKDMTAFERQKTLRKHYDLFLYIILNAIDSYLDFYHKWDDYLEEKEKDMEKKQAPPLQISALDVCVIGPSEDRVVRRVLLAVRDWHQ